MKKFYTINFIFIAFAICPIKGFSQTATLDAGFGDAGKILTNFIGFSSYASCIAIQTNGKIVAAGYGSNGTDDDFALARYNTNGSLDNTFGTGGKVTTPIGVSYDNIRSIAIQSDGKIVVAGSSQNGTKLDFALARYNTNGSLDAGFDGDGKLTTAIGISGDEAFSIAIQSDGKIVVAGRSYNGSNFDIALARYNTNGSLDASFDGDGKLTTAIGSLHDIANSIVIQSDGKIVVAGYSNNGSDNDFALARYNTNGSLDISFDGDGKLTTAIGVSNDVANSLLIQSNGKIVVAGYSNNGSDNDFALARYNTNGSLDAGFDGNGILTTAIGSSNDIANSIAIQGDGKIEVAGYSLNGSNGVFALARYNTDGSPDASFDGDGMLTTAIENTRAYAFSTSIQSDGKIVAAGNSYNGTNDNFALARYNTDGSLDVGFDLDGRLTTGIGSSNDFAKSIAIQSDGKIVVAGNSQNGTDNDFVLARYHTYGALDVSFDGDGKLTTAIGSSHDFAYSVAIQSDGKIVVAGHSYNGSKYDFALARYNTNGSPDVGFDGDGKLTTSIGTLDDGLFSIAIQSDGKIVVAGYSHNGTNYDFALARYNINGTLDLSFSGDGKLTTAIGSLADVANSLSIQGDGKIVVAGYSQNGTKYDFAVARYNTDGSPDPSFDGDGKLTTAIGSVEDLSFSVAIQTDGKIVVAGYSNNGSDNDFALIRYNTDGSLDAAFDGDGKLTTAIGTSYDFAYSVALQNDGKIVVAGRSTNGTYNDFALARYNTNGSLDAGFDGDGKVMFDLFSGRDESGTAMKLNGNRIYIAGDIAIEGGRDFALVAVINDAFALPLSLLEFNGRLSNNHAVLSWKTTNEVNTLSFDIERSTDGSSYVVVGNVAAANQPGIQQYNYTDDNITSLTASVVYYRLRQRDIDDRFVYSRIVALSIDNSRNMVMFYPNPVINEVSITVTVNKKEKLKGRIIDNAGKLITQQQWNLSPGSTSLSIDVNGLAGGMYYLELKGETINERKQFIKQ